MNLSNQACFSQQSPPVKAGEILPDKESETEKLPIEAKLCAQSDTSWMAGTMEDAPLLQVRERSWRSEEAHKGAAWVRRPHSEISARLWGSPASGGAQYN